MKLQLIKNTNFNKENFFNKKELQEILNLYGSMVSAGEWKEYGIFSAEAGKRGFLPPESIYPTSETLPNDIATKASAGGWS